MRLGFGFFPSMCAYYRAIGPMQAMASRGHEVVGPADGEGEVSVERLASCDVVHVYRRFDAQTYQTLAALAQSGTAITYDNDDNLAALPKESPNYRRFGGLTGERSHAMTVKLARLARVFTTTTEALAEAYRRSRVERVEVIGNYLLTDVPGPRVPHDGVIVGWVGGVEHQADAARVPIADALRRLIAKHDNVRVECIGVDLKLPEAYRHVPGVPFHELPAHIGRFDIGIAPLADLRLNQTRSDIKLKEYSASGVPWLASSVGPYAGLGEEQGGQLVSDDGWFDALDRLVTRERERERLARNALTWASSNTIEAAAERWERVFARAAGLSADARPSSRPQVSLGALARHRRPPTAR
jgi:glycosyltransferase involved in cell wall biosynthesis